MRAADLIAAVFFVGLGISAAVAGWRLGPGTAAEPGPGFFILAAGIGLTVLGLLLGVTSRRRNPAGPLSSLWDGLRWERAAMTAGLLMLYALLIEQAGFFVLTGAMMFGLFLGTDRRQWRFALVASLLATASTYVVFDRWLGSDLPVGTWLEPWLAWSS